MNDLNFKKKDERDGTVSGMSYTQQSKKSEKRKGKKNTNTSAFKQDEKEYMSFEPSDDDDVPPQINLPSKREIIGGVPTKAAPQYTNNDRDRSQIFSQSSDESNDDIDIKKDSTLPMKVAYKELGFDNDLYDDNKSALTGFTGADGR